MVYGPPMASCVWSSIRYTIQMPDDFREPYSLNTFFHHEILLSNTRTIDLTFSVRYLSACYIRKPPAQNVQHFFTDRRIAKHKPPLFFAMSHEMDNMCCNALVHIDNQTEYSRNCKERHCIRTDTNCLCIIHFYDIRTEA